MHLRLDRDRIQQTIAKNAATSYGLTLAIGLPFPVEISCRILHLRQKLEEERPGRFTWYAPSHYHATLLAPLRGRYREQPPLRRNELPEKLPDFLSDLAAFFSQSPPFPLELGGVSLSADGLVVVGERTLLQRLSARLQNYPELDQPKRLDGLHVTIGSLNTAQLVDTDVDRQQVEATLRELGSATVGAITVQRVWLVHYANRTLNRIVGKVPFALGQPTAIDAPSLLCRLGIA